MLLCLQVSEKLELTPRNTSSEGCHAGLSMLYQTQSLRAGRLTSTVKADFPASMNRMPKGPYHSLLYKSAWLLLFLVCSICTLRDSVSVSTLFIALASREPWFKCHYYEGKQLLSINQLLRSIASP
jgi:hypothetical protein